MADASLGDFIDEASGLSRLRVEQDLGGGFVRLRLTEAERRQAAQDIRSSEDVLIELLRNARDAGARRILVALQRDGAQRRITVIDDGEGIPEAMHERIFEPRVTSKLDTAHMDKWGMHGRGMALFSIRENAADALVAFSAPGKGSALRVRTDTGSLGERADQSTFPRFELGEGGVAAMRGPRNLLRTCAEFALEHRGDCSVYCGSPAEVAATLLQMGMAVTTPTARAFAPDPDDLPIFRWLACAPDAEEAARRARLMGLDLSERTARRVMNGEVKPLEPMLDLLERELRASQEKGKGPAHGKRPAGSVGRVLKLADDDRRELAQGAARSFAPIAERYYLEADVEPRITVGADALTIAIPLIPQD